jgi:predicted PurR-regulated permease PerM
MDGGKNINITISSGTIFKSIIILLSVVLVFYVKDLVLVVLTAIVLASSIEPLTRWLKRFRISRVPAVIIIYLSLGLIASGILYFFIPPFVQDTAGFLKSVPKYIDTISLWNPLNTQEVATSKATAVAVSEGLTQGVRVVRDFSETFSIKEVFEELANTFSNVSEGVLKVLSIVFGGILGDQ